MGVCSPTVSVVIPTYRHRDHVLKTLESVFAQTFADFEIVVVNDGSPDDTAARLQPLADAGRIRYFEQPNAGQAAARNTGIEKARGRFIALLDDDDLWPVDKLQWQVERLEATPRAGVVAGMAELIDGDGESRGRLDFSPSITFESLLLSNPICSPGQTLIRADLLREIGGLRPGIWGADDWDLWLQLVRRAEIVMDERIALRYRIHAGNASRQLRRMFRNCQAVLETHLPHAPAGDRKRLRASAYSALYEFFAGRLVAEAKGDLKGGRLRSAAANVAQLLQPPSALLRQPRLLGMTLAHLSPGLRGAP